MKTLRTKGEFRHSAKIKIPALLVYGSVSRVAPRVTYNEYAPLGTPRIRSPTRRNSGILYPSHMGFRSWSTLSRLMKDGIGAGMTETDHPALSAQLYAAYARARQARVLASVVGEDGLSDTDRRFIRFGERFESELVNQDGPRTLEQSMTAGWQLLHSLPRGELHRLSDVQIIRHLGKE